MDKLLTRENITLALAVFGAVGTLVTWIYHWFTSRKSLEVQLLRIYTPSKALACFFSISNKSRLPISVLSVSVFIDGVSFQNVPIPHITYSVSTTRNGETTIKHEYPALTFPINLTGLSGTSGFVDFEIPEEVSQKIATPLIVQVATNRGNLSKTALEFQGYSDMTELL